MCFFFHIPLLNKQRLLQSLKIAILPMSLKYFLHWVWKLCLHECLFISIFWIPKLFVAHSICNSKCSVLWKPRLSSQSRLDFESRLADRYLDLIIAPVFCLAYLWPRSIIFDWLKFHNQFCFSWKNIRKHVTIS